MKKLYQSLGIGALALTLAGNVFAGDLKKDDYQIIEGKPISVTSAASDSYRSLSVVLEVENDSLSDLKKNTKKILAHRLREHLIMDFTDTHALIQAEIDDNDEQNIKIKGKYCGQAFCIKEVTVEDYTIDFEHDPMDKAYFEKQSR